MPEVLRAARELRRADFHSNRQLRRPRSLGRQNQGDHMRCKHCKRGLTVWACASAIALSSGSAALAQLSTHPVVQTLEPTHEEIQPVPDEPPQSLKFGY